MPVTLDFIFGAATAWFEKCHIPVLRDGTFTAVHAGDQPFGFVFLKLQNHRRTILKTRTYLGGHGDLCGHRFPEPGNVHWSAGRQ